MFRADEFRLWTGRHTIKSQLCFLDSFLAAILNVFPETSSQGVHKSTPKLNMARALCFSSLSNTYFFSPGWPQAHCVAEGDLDWILLLSKCWDDGAGA